MDILTHALSGVAVATCTSAFLPKSYGKKIKLLTVGLIVGAFPDVDAISMWSKFDSTFGSCFNLTYTGKVIYGSKLWYSHHAFFHSLAGSILFAVLFFILLYVCHRFLLKKQTPIIDYFKANIIFPVTFILAYWAHLAGDLPTPSSVWGGISFLWPTKDYIGGFGKIWWWNNYDIFLIILGVIIINLLLHSFMNGKKLVFITVPVFLLGLVLIITQINNRQFDYAYTSHTNKYAQMELNSKKEQKRILGKHVYKYTEWFDRKMKFHF